MSFQGLAPRSVLPSVRRPHKSYPLEPIAQPLEVLFHPNSTTSDRWQAEVSVDPPHHLLRAVSQLAVQRVAAHRRAAVERLQWRPRTAGVDLPPLELRMALGCSIVSTRPGTGVLGSSGSGESASG